MEKSMTDQQFEIKDSGQRQSFDTGAVRDTDAGKARFDLIPPTALYRVAMHYGNGARKYAPRNWQKGMQFSRFIASTFRHIFSWIMGDRSEDHLSACVFNIMAIMYFEDIGRNDLNDVQSGWLIGSSEEDLNNVYQKIQDRYEKGTIDTK